MSPRKSGGYASTGTSGGYASTRTSGGYASTRKSVCWPTATSFRSPLCTPKTSSVQTARVRPALTTVPTASRCSPTALVTPMALLMTYLAAPELAGMNMVQERVVDTLIGVTVGMVLALIFSTLDDRAHLAQHHAEWGE